jgi:hypothetical protein
MSSLPKKAPDQVSTHFGEDKTDDYNEASESQTLIKTWTYDLFFRAIQH